MNAVLITNPQFRRGEKMSIHVQCVSCEKKLKAGNELAGKRFKCPRCGEFNVVAAADKSAQRFPSDDDRSGRSRLWPWLACGAGVSACVVGAMFLGFTTEHPKQPRENENQKIAALTPPANTNEDGKNAVSNPSTESANSAEKPAPEPLLDFVIPGKKLGPVSKEKLEPRVDGAIKPPEVKKLDPIPDLDKLKVKPKPQPKEKTDSNSTVKLFSGGSVPRPKFVDSARQLVRICLDMIAKEQHQDGLLHGGSWKNGKNVAVDTASALLLFVSSGHTHRPSTHKNHRMIVGRSLVWLFKRQSPTGKLPGGAIGHAMGSLALSELSFLTFDPVIRRRTESAVNYIIQSQKPDGGWAEIGERSDLATTAWQVMALKSAQRAGFRVPKTTVSKIRQFLNTLCDDKARMYSNHAGAIPSVESTALGLFCRLQTQPFNEPDSWLSEGIKIHLIPNPPKKDHSPTYLFFATQVMYGVFDDNWDKWRKQLWDYFSKLNRVQDVDVARITNAGKLSDFTLSLMTLEILQLPDRRRTSLFARNGIRKKRRPSPAAATPKRKLTKDELAKHRKLESLLDEIHPGNKDGKNVIARLSWRKLAEGFRGGKLTLKCDEKTSTKVLEQKLGTPDKIENGEMVYFIITNRIRYQVRYYEYLYTRFGFDLGTGEIRGVVIDLRSYLDFHRSISAESP